MNFMKIFVTYYGVFGVLQLINAERHYSYIVPREELQPLMDKLAKFSKCNSQNTTGTINYEFIFTTDHLSSSCSPYNLLKKEFFKDVLQNEINNTVTYFITSEQDKIDLMDVKLISDTNTSLLPAQNGQGTDIPSDIGLTSEPPTKTSTTLDPLQEELIREKKKRNDVIASIITGVLVALLIGSILVCACAQYVKTVKQSATYTVNNP